MAYWKLTGEIEMKVIKNEIVNGKTELTIERTVLFFFKKQEKYIAASRLVGEFYSWVKAPNNTIVPDHMSFQLDKWKQLDI